MSLKPGIAFVVVVHHSELIRPFGFKAFSRFVKTLYGSLKSEFKLFVIDNQSEGSLVCDLVKSLSNVDYTFVADQSALGLTGAWNLGIKKAADFEVIAVCNDDIGFDDSLNDFIAAIVADVDRDATVYGPLMHNPNWPKQHAKEKSNEKNLTKLTGMQTLHDSFFAITGNFVKHFAMLGGDLFDANNPLADGEGKWAYQYGMFKIWEAQGAKQKIFNGCWIDHAGTCSWKIMQSLQVLENRAKGRQTVLQIIEQHPEQVAALREFLTNKGRVDTL